MENGCNRWFTAEEARRTNFINDFSAVCFMSVRDVARLHSDIGQTKPVALVQSAVGGTRVSAWMSSEAIEKAAIKAGMKPGPGANSNNRVSVLYNAMISPFNKMSIRAAMWYQGEANAETSYPVSKTLYYASYLEAMIESWRTLKGDNFDFFIVTLPPSVFEGTPDQMGTGRMEVRIAELEVANTLTHNSAAPVCTELGGSSKWGIDHPFNKVEISRRLALQIVHETYDSQDRVDAVENGTLLYSSTWTGPIVSDVTANEGNVTITFEEFSSVMLTMHDVKGLNSDGTRDDCTLCCEKQPPFEVSSDGTNWTRIDRSDVVLGLSSVTLQGTKSVTKIRYGWMDAPECVLMNEDLLPLAPFVYSINQ